MISQSYLCLSLSLDTFSIQFITYLNINNLLCFIFSVYKQNICHKYPQANSYICIWYERNVTDYDDGDIKINPITQSVYRTIFSVFQRKFEKQQHINKHTRTHNKYIFLIHFSDIYLEKIEVTVFSPKFINCFLKTFLYSPHSGYFRLYRNCISVQT